MKVAMGVIGTLHGSDITLYTSMDSKHHMSKKEAYELARALIACADLMTEFEKRDPNTGRFRKGASG